ncbi:TIGR03086 family protein [Actinomadura sp. NAK00032]|uniref:TIGR03086 family metal-binding protein n=1 Tax=Actinomadura sp. NAK00032 TaxID=2742128 RepID=UPI00159278AA|nr:TIGR03086 family metal-binding protein [Actinomadura sp. NAK00032]QKW33977.1 TIGR03086 family protein [Actinomadura sp. NAK00032]
MRVDANGGRLLDRAIGFALTAAQGVLPHMLARRTPCASWDLGMLLLHVADSLAALHEGMAGGHVERRSEPAGADDPVSELRVQAVRVLRASAARGTVTVGDRRLQGDLMAAAGAVEVAVHGWDIAQATGEGRRIPPVLAADLLAVCPLVLPAPPRGPLFADPVEPPDDAPPGDRLVALLGRRPAMGPRPEDARSGGFGENRPVRSPGQRRQTR